MTASRLPDQAFAARRRILVASYDELASRREKHMYRIPAAFLCCLTLAGCGTSMQRPASGDTTPTQLVEAVQDEMAVAVETARC